MTDTNLRCIIEGCPNIIRNRGLCSTHYKQTQRAVWDGETSWEQRVAEGRALPAKKSRFMFGFKAGRFEL